MTMKDVQECMKDFLWYRRSGDKGITTGCVRQSISEGISFCCQLIDLLWESSRRHKTCLPQETEISVSLVDPFLFSFSDDDRSRSFFICFECFCRKFCLCLFRFFSLLIRLFLMSRLCYTSHQDTAQDHILYHVKPFSAVLPELIITREAGLTDQTASPVSRQTKRKW